MLVLPLLFIACNPENKTAIIDTGKAQAEPAIEPGAETDESGETDSEDTTATADTTETEDSAEEE